MSAGSVRVRRGRRVLIDSAGYFAHIDSRERHHQEARIIAAGLQAGRWSVFTTNFVVAEAHALLLSRLGRPWATRFLHDLDQSRGTNIVRVTAADEQRARDIVDRYEDKDFSLTDAISFSVMERLEIAFAFTFDQHFAQYGWQVLSPAQF